MNIKHTLKNLPRAPSSDSVVVSDIKNIMETSMADIRFILIMAAKNGRICVHARNDLTKPFYCIQVATRELMSHAAGAGDCAGSCCSILVQVTDTGISCMSVGRVEIYHL
jgi:hypothetical protein